MFSSLFRCRKSSKVDSSLPFVLPLFSRETKLIFPYHTEKLWASSGQSSLWPLYTQFLNTWATWRCVSLSDNRWNALLCWSWGAGCIFSFTFGFYLWRMRKVLWRNALTLTLERHVVSCRSLLHVWAYICSSNLKESLSWAFPNAGETELSATMFISRGSWSSIIPTLAVGHLKFNDSHLKSSWV